MWNWIEKVHELNRTGRPFALVLVTHASGSVPREPGAKMVVFPDGTSWGTIGGGRLEQLVLADAVASLEDGQPRARRYPLGPSAGQCCGGVVEVFVEPLLSNPELYLFGAGHVGQAVAKVLEGTPFRVTVIDERSEWVNAPALGDAVRRWEAPWFDVVGEIPIHPERTYLAIMTHRHDLDQDIVEWAVGQKVKYIGLIGSRTKWAKFQARLLEKGISQECLNRVKCPIGLAVGGKAPQEVAISVAGELLKTHYGD